MKLENGANCHDLLGKEAKPTLGFSPRAVCDSGGQ